MHLEQLVEESGIKREPLIRSLIMGVDLRPRPPEAYTELLRQMAAIGNNINQIAKIANGTGQVRRDDILYIKEMQGRLWRQIKAL